MRIRVEDGRRLVRELPSDRTRTTRFIETFPRPSFRSWPNAYSEAGPVGNRGWSGSKKSPCPRNVAGWRPRRKHAWHPLVRSLPPSVVDAHLQLLWRHGRQRLAARTWCRPSRRRRLGATLEPEKGHRHLTAATGCMISSSRCFLYVWMPRLSENDLGRLSRGVCCKGWS